MKTFELFGTKMHALTMHETLEQIDNNIQQDGFMQHSVVNVAKLVNMQTDRQLAASVNNCDLVNIDGMGVVWGASLLGYPVKERITGVDLFVELMTLCQQQQYPIYLLGASQQVLDRLLAKLARQYPQLKVAGAHHGYFWDKEQEVVQQIGKSGARLLFVAISSPMKENFINRWQKELGVNFVMGVGGTFDVLAGKVKRAPLWMQKSGLEWLFRVLQEPGRMWKRYLFTNSKFIWMVIKAKLAKSK